MAKGQIVILSGPSGVGKDTVIDEWRKADPRVERIVAFTTRDMRPNEKNGVDYWFVSTDEFMRMAGAGEFLEFKPVVGGKYATPLEPLERALSNGKIAILKIDVQGAKDVMELRPEAVSVFILPPSMEELESRLTKRGTETAEQIAKRMDTARREVAESPNYHYRFINDQVENVVQKLKELTPP